MIREATLEDANDIAQIHVTTWRDAYTGITPVTYLNQLSVRKSSERWMKLLKDNDRKTLVTTNQNDQIIGWASFGPSRDKDGEGTGELYAIYLKSSEWGKGHGKSLLESSENMIFDLGFNVITLWVLELNTRTRRFYESAGYQNESINKQIELDKQILNELRYRKLLNYE